jgi:MFS family permease
MNMHVPTTIPPITDVGLQNWNRSYEVKAVSLLALGFGMVGLDRFIISPLFPFIQKELGLNYQDLGLISAVLALTWGIASVLGGRLSDRIGTKQVLVPAIVIFSLLVAMSGLAAGMASLLLVRGLMGLAEGAYVPASIVATAEASRPTRIGMNVGIQQMAAPLFGLGLGFGPVVAVELLKVVPSWHWVFAAVALPGLGLAVIMARVLRDSRPPAAPKMVTGRLPGPREALRYRGVVVNTATMICYLTCVITISAFMPNYLTDYLKLSTDQMALVLAGQGVGSFVGMVAVPALSDRIGRKSVLVTALLCEVLALMVLPRIGAAPMELFAILFVVTFMNAGAIAITVGPMTRSAVPAYLTSTATGIVVGVGEIMGGAVAPAVAGVLAQRLGITVIPLIALSAIILATVVVVSGVRRREDFAQSQRA